MTDAPKQEKPLDPLRNVPRVAEPEPIEGQRTPDGRLILRDETGRAYTDSSAQTGGIRTYLDETDYPPELPEGESAPPPLKIVPPQAAPTAASAFAPAPPEELDPREALQTSAKMQAPIATEVHAAPAAGVASFSSTQVTAAQDAAPKPATPDAVQKVIDATLAHRAAQPKGEGQ